METGRYHAKTSNSSKCIYCKNGMVDDEAHFTMECRDNTGTFCTNLLSRKPCFLYTLSSQEKMMYGINA